MRENEVNEKKVSIILVNYNGFSDTVECIESIKKNTYSNYELIVVDNGSTEKPTTSDLNAIKETSIFIPLEKNIGFSGGNNVGIRYAIEHGSDYVLLLNNDTVVERHFLTQMVNAAQKKNDLGVIGGKIKYYSNPDKIWFGGGGFDESNGYVWHKRYNQTDDQGGNDIIEQSFLTGCLMLIPIPIINTVGLLDEKFFLYCEDTEFSCRVRKHGFKLWLCEDAVIYHKVSASSGANSYITTYYSVRNTLYVGRMYCNNMRALYQKYFVLWIKKVLKRQLKIRPIIRGIIDYKMGKKGQIEYK